MLSARLRSVAVFGVLAAACGGSAPQNDEGTILTSHADLCAGAAPEYADHVVTMISCPWVQHTDNITRFGAHESRAAALVDATGQTVATITDTCDVWAMGVDPQGVAVLIRRDTGDVKAHGNVHPGQELSALPSPLALPLTLRE